MLTWLVPVGVFGCLVSKDTTIFMLAQKMSQEKRCPYCSGRIYYAFSHVLMNVRYFEVICKTNHKKQEFISGDNKDNVIKVFRVIERARQ